MELERGKLAQELDQTRRAKSAVAEELAGLRLEMDSAREKLAEARREMSRYCYAVLKCVCMNVGSMLTCVNSILSM
jgi:hypothetical protein